MGLWFVLGWLWCFLCSFFWFVLVWVWWWCVICVWDCMWFGWCVVGSWRCWCILGKLGCWGFWFLGRIGRFWRVFVWWCLGCGCWRFLEFWFCFCLVLGVLLWMRLVFGLGFGRFCVLLCCWLMFLCWILRLGCREELCFFFLCLFYLLFMVLGNFCMSICSDRII